MSRTQSESSEETPGERPWFAGGLSFECTQCGHCCSGPGTGFVWVSESEIQNLAEAMGLGNDIDAFERKFTRRIGVKTSLVEYSDGDCIFLDKETRGCSVYHARPTQCRTWPFWHSNLDSPKSWSKAARDCPGCNHGPLYSLADIKNRLTSDID